MVNIFGFKTNTVTPSIAMATLEDRILGEKTHYYCSSSEDEEEEAPPPAPPPQPQGPGVSNTGPKGVLDDWRRYKQLESEKRAAQEKEKLDLAKKFSLSCLSSREEAELREKEDLEDELDELLTEEILLNFQKQRMHEMLERLGRLPQFGKVIHLQSSREYLDAIDEENKGVTVVIHIYEPANEACRAMNGCLVSLAEEYTTVKFCKLLGSHVGVSKQFKVSGVPALLIYKAGQMIGNFVRLTDVFGDDFYASDVENFLIEHGMLPDKSLCPQIISQDKTNKDEDSDVSLD